MIVVAELPFDSNVIVVLVAVIFAAIKAFLERGKTAGEDVELPDEEELYEQYEAELQRQREAMEIPAPTTQPPRNTAPPPLPKATVAPTQKPIKPVLSTAEKKALENLQLRSSRSKGKPKPSRQTTKSRVYRHLASPTAAREALLLAEILGPPTAFKEER